MELLSIILIIVGPCLFAYGIIKFLSAKVFNSGAKNFIVSVLIMILGIIVIVGSFEVDRTIESNLLNQMESRSLIIEDVYVDKTSNNGRFVNLVKDNYYKTFKIYFIGESLKIKPGDRIDIKFDPETNTILKIFDVRNQENIVQDPFITNSFKENKEK